MLKKILAAVLGLSLALVGAAPSYAYAKSTTWKGNGASIVDGQIVPSSQQCDAQGDVEGSYLLWVLAAAGSASLADIDFDGPGGNAPVAMTKSGGSSANASFKYVQSFGVGNPIPAPVTPVVATHNGTRTGNLVISHGCNFAPNPALYLTKTIDTTAGTPDAEGETVYYNITVTNSGNVPLADVVLSDNNGEIDPTTCRLVAGPSHDGAMSVGQEVTCVATHVITATDMTNGYVDNTATATDSSSGATDDDSAHLPLVEEPSLTITKHIDYTEGTPDEVGEVLHYEITVTNTGNVNLTDVVLTDNKGTIDRTSCHLDAEDPNYDGSLAIGASVVCLATHTITNEDMLAEGVTNTATASSESKELSESDTAVHELDPEPDLTIEKTIYDYTADSEGDVIVFQIVVTNSGNVDLANVVLTDDNGVIDGTQCRLVSGDNYDGELLIGDSVTCFATHEVTGTDMENLGVDNTATAEDDTKDLSASSNVFYPLEPISDFSLSKQESSTGPYAVGDTITYTVVVTNTGNTVLTNLSLTDANATLVTGEGECSFPASLNPGATMTCHYTHVVSQAEMDLCEVNNTVTGTADGELSASSDEVTIGLPCQDPALSISKSVASVSAYAVNGVITYTILVTNTSNVTATEVTVADEFADITGCTPANGSDLAPSASMTCTATHTVSVNNFDSGKYDNYATASSNGGTVNVTSNTVSTPFVPNTPGISVTKALAGPNPVKAGDVVTFTITVSNTGNVRLDGVNVADANAVIGTCSQALPATLQPNESMTCSATHEVTDADVEAGKVVNVATTSATTGSVNGTSNEVVVPLEARPAMSITKALSGPAPILAGDTVTYTLTIKNTGNVKLEGITVTDENAVVGACSQAIPATLAIGATMTCTATHVVTGAEVTAGEVRNVAAAASTTGPTNANSNEIVIPMAKPGLSIRKAITGTAPKKVGDTITYTITVTNTGNIKLTNVLVVDDNATITSCTKPNPVAELAVNESFSCTATHKVTTADAQAGEVLNTAVASANENVTASSSAGSAASGSVQSNAVKLVLKLTAGGSTKGGVKNPKYPGLAYTGGEESLKFDDAEFLFLLLAAGLVFGIRRRIKARKN